MRKMSEPFTTFHIAFTDLSPVKVKGQFIKFSLFWNVFNSFLSNFAKNLGAFTIFKKEKEGV